MPGMRRRVRRALRALGGASKTALVSALLAASCASSPSPEPREEDGSRKQDPQPASAEHERRASEDMGRAYSARALENQYDLEGASQAYRRALEKDPLSPRLHRSLARVLFKAGRREEAVALLEGYLQRREDAEVRLYLIGLYDRLNRGGEADRLAARFLEGSGPLDADVARAAAERMLRAGDVKAAASLLERTRSPEDRPGRGAVLAGELLLQRGYLDEARAAFEKATDASPGSRGWLGLAEVRSRLRDWEGASEAATKYVEAHGRDVEGLVKLATYLVKAGDLESASRRLEKAVSLDPSGAIFAQLARVHRMRGDRERALEAYREARRRLPDDPRLTFQYATLLDETGHVDKAEKALASAASREKDNPFLSHYLAYVWARRGVRLEAAEAAAREAVGAMGDVGAFHAVLGYVLFRRGRLEEARASFREALAGDPDPFVHRLYGTFLLEAGSKDEALAQLKKAVDLDPRLEPVLAERIREAGG